MRILTLIIPVLVIVFSFQVSAGESYNLPKGLQGLTLEGLYYLKYQAGQSDNGMIDYNQFAVKRGYLTVKKEVNSFISSRITLDTYQDDTGDMKVRIKYVYADFKFPEFLFITKPHAEFGIVHRPWLDFEEHVNYYRMLDTMFMEREGLFNSADFGFTFAGYFAGELDKDYQNTVNKKYPGRYGSFAVGIYNGGGYHAEESNQNKTFESRLTLRPLPDVIPGLQISGLFITGKGNGSGTIDEIDDWQTLAGMLSFEQKYVTLTGTFVSGYGNKSGSYSEDSDYSGFSVFGEGKLDKHWRIVGRFDSFDLDVDFDNDAYTRIIAGAGYDFGHHNILILDYEITSYEDSDIEDDNRLQLTMQIHF